MWRTSSCIVTSDRDRQSPVVGNCTRALVVVLFVVASRTLPDSSRSPRVTGMASSETRGGSMDDYDDDDMDQQESLST